VRVRGEPHFWGLPDHREFGRDDRSDMRKKVSRQTLKFEMASFVFLLKPKYNIITVTTILKIGRNYATQLQRSITIHQSGALMAPI
jgi:hypothetical protein